MICSSTLEFWLNFRFFFLVSEGCFIRQNFCIALRKCAFLLLVLKLNIYTHIYVYIYIYVYIHIHWIYVYIYMYPYVHMCIYIYMHMMVSSHISIVTYLLISLFYCGICFFLWFLYWWINLLSIAHVTSMCIYILVHISFLMTVI